MGACAKNQEGFFIQNYWRINSNFTIILPRRHSPEILFLFDGFALTSTIIQGHSPNTENNSVKPVQNSVKDFIF